jgi:hypothetical protein
VTPKAQLGHARGKYPERYRAGERFEPSAFEWLPPEEVQWHYLGEARQLPPGRDVFLTQMLKAGLLRQVPALASGLQCNGLQRCPQTGIWEGRVATDHPLAALYNRWEQQAFIEQDQSFPDPRGRFLDIAMEDLQWTYRGSRNGEPDAAGAQQILL